MNLIPLKLRPRPLRRNNKISPVVLFTVCLMPGFILSRGVERRQTRAQPLDLIQGLLLPLDSYDAVSSQRGVQEEGVLHTGLRPARL